MVISANSIGPLRGRVSKLTIKGFRSLRNIDGLALPQLTVLIGANGAGKSTLIRFFEMLSWMFKSHNLQEFVLRHGGGDDQFFMGARNTAKIVAELCIDTDKGSNEYGFELAHISANDTLMVMNEAYRYSNKALTTKAGWTKVPDVGREASLSSHSNPTAEAISGLLKRCSTYQFHDTSVNAAIRKRWDVSECFYLRSDGGNLAAVLLDLQGHDEKRYALIQRQLQRVLPAFSHFVLEPAAGKVLLRWQGKFSDKTFGAHLTSDGSLRLFCLITLLNMPADRLPDVMLFDEPELGLHPHAMTLVSEMLKRVATTRQVIIATQSPFMVDCFDLENVIVASAHNGETTLHNLPHDQYQTWLDDDYLLSDIWLKTPVGTAQ